MSGYTITIRSEDESCTALFACEINNSFRKLNLKNPNCDYTPSDLKVIRLNGDPVGLIAYSVSKARQSVEVLSLTILPQYQRKGIAARTLKCLFEMYNSRYLEGIALAQSEAFWARMGANWSVTPARHAREIREYGYAPFILYKRTFMSRVGKHLN